MKMCIISYYNMAVGDSGGPVRTYNLARSLSDQGFKIKAFIPGKEYSHLTKEQIPIDKIRGKLPYSVLQVLSKVLGITKVESLYFYDLSFIVRIFQETADSELIQIDAPVPAGAIATFVLSTIFGKLVVVDAHDTFQVLRMENSNVLRRTLELFMEKVSYKYADLILVVSEVDKEILVKRGVEPGKVIIVPNGVDTSAFSFREIERAEQSRTEQNLLTVIFVGNMEYAPNQDAANLIVSKIAPTVSSQVKDVRFLLVGRKPPRYPPIKSNLTFTGVVANIVELLSSCDVAIAPLRYGSGTRLKILEYFSCALPVVSTSKGVEGLGVTNGVNVLVEDDIESFSNKIVELLRDKKFRSDLGNAGREVVVQKYNWFDIAKKLGEKYRALTENQRTD